MLNSCVHVLDDNHAISSIVTHVRSAKNLVNKHVGL